MSTARHIVAVLALCLPGGAPARPPHLSDVEWWARLRERTDLRERFGSTIFYADEGYRYPTTPQPVPTPSPRVADDAAPDAPIIHGTIVAWTLEDLFLLDRGPKLPAVSISIAAARVVDAAGRPIDRRLGMGAIVTVYRKGQEASLVIRTGHVLDPP